VGFEVYFEAVVARSPVYTMSRYRDCFFEKLSDKAFSIPEMETII